MQTQFTIPTFGDARLPPRFWAKVNPNGPIPARRPELGPCWLWTAALTTKGYSKFWFDQRLWPGHLLLYVSIIGPVPAGLELDHLCRNRACLRLNHLDPVTHRENCLRGDFWQLAKTHCPQGHPYDEANTYFRTEGHRRCRECDKIQLAERRRALSEAMLAATFRRQ